MLLFNAKNRRIRELTDKLNAIASGSQDYKFRTDYKDGIGSLSEAISLCVSLFREKVSALEKEVAKSHAILNSMAEGVIITDIESRIVSFNPSIEEIFHVTRAASQGKFFLEVISNTDISEVISEVLRNKEFISREISLLWPVQRVFHVNASPLLEEERISGCLVVIHDITEIRRLEAMRRDFIANISHEIKTPLTSIKGYVETLLEGAMDDKENRIEFLNIIRNHTNRLNTLIEDLLNLSYLESGSAALDKTAVNLYNLTQEVLSGFKGQALRRNIKIVNNLPSDISVAADKNMMYQVFNNLLDNAFKFNKDNTSIKIYSETISGLIKVTIEDSGCGIPEKEAGRIFERFYRVDKARSRELGGTGLGLSIVKHIIELHLGTVGVDSIEGIGSKFWFTIPCLSE
ncbi:MAG: PAS domain-containing protein [Candidatus Omnitrophota bacterium]|jgi:two-component system phosphate regulon sensor histidine kinase PhoR|nr:MAG: PAS domain-containing protein [Candidatus Omnitrophota bacterium]